MNERSLVLWIAAGLAAAIALAVVAYVVLGGGADDDAGDGSSAAGGNAASSLEGGPDEILYLSGTSLVRRNLENQEEEPVGTIETPSVYASPGSQWVAYVTSETVDDGDFAAQPLLHLYDVETGEKSKHGAGVAPVWNPTGTHVAYLRPVEPRECEGETCAGDVQIGVVEAASGEESVLLDPGRYTILDWAGDWIFVSDFADPSEVTAVNLADEETPLGMPASQFWDASPDGRWIVKANAKKTEFVSWDGDELAVDRVTVELGEYQLLEGSWAHDSSQVAAAVGLPGKKGLLETRVVTFSPDDPELVEVNDSFGASGSVLWAVDNESVVFASLLDPKRALFQAKSCTLGNQSTCEIVTSWTEGVALLRTE